MTNITQFYLEQARYQVGIGDQIVTLHLNYAGNTFTIDGSPVAEVETIAQQLLQKKHGVNFAYKFNDKMGENL